MGWGYGVVGGREVGYSVEAECDEPGCTVRIDRGLGWICGDMHGQDDEAGCSGYFCGEHLGHEHGPAEHRCRAFLADLGDDEFADGYLAAEAGAAASVLSGQPEADR